MNYRKQVLPAALLLISGQCLAFTQRNLGLPGWGAKHSKSVTCSSSSAVEVEVITGDENEKSTEGIVVKAPIKMLGPYPSLALRFPNLSTSGQREQGKSGVSLDFILDTAANTNSMLEPIVKELAPPMVTRQMYNLGDTQLEGVMEEIFISDLEVASLAGGNTNAAGLMSLAFFGLFPGGVEFSWTGKPSVTFYGGKEEQSTQDKTMVPIVPLPRAGNLPSITLMLNGVEVKALVATSSPITVMNEAAAELAGVDRMVTAGKDKKELEAAGDVITIQNAKGRSVPLVKSNEAVDVKAGLVEFGKVPIYVGDEIPGMDALASESNGAAVVLGLDVLVQRPGMLLRTRDNELWLA